MLKRSDYMADSSRLHDEYYLQFGTERMEERIHGAIGMKLIMASTDPHMNDIPLAMWDKLYPSFQVLVDRSLLEKAEEDMSLSTSVCVLKALARKMQQDERSKAVSA